MVQGDTRSVISHRQQHFAAILTRADGDTRLGHAIQRIHRILYQIDDDLMQLALAADHLQSVWQVEHQFRLGALGLYHPIGGGVDQTHQIERLWLLALVG